MLGFHEPTQAYSIKRKSSATGSLGKEVTMLKAMDFYHGAQEYESASLKAFWQEMIGHLRGKPAQLLSFDEVRSRLRLREESYNSTLSKIKQHNIKYPREGQ